MDFKKLMRNNNYPSTMTAITYKISLDFIQKSTGNSEENKPLLLGEKAKSFYGFNNIQIPQKVKNMVED